MVNRFFNMAAFNPGGREGPDVPGREEGYLFWLAWVPPPVGQHLLDRRRPRPVPALAGRGQLPDLPRARGQDRPEPEFLMNLTPLLTNPELCGE